MACHQPVEQQPIRAGRGPFADGAELDAARLSQDVRQKQLAEAAAAAGRNRSSVLRAIKAGKISDRSLLVQHPWPNALPTRFGCA